MDGCNTSSPLVYIKYRNDSLLVVTILETLIRLSVCDIVMI